MQVGREWRRSAALLAVSSLPLVAMAAISIMIIAVRLYNVLPASPWDSAAMVEADRIARGLPLYQMPSTGHSGWMYGPIGLLIGGALFAVFGVSPILFKLVSVFSFLLLAYLGVIAATPHLVARWRVLAALSFIAIDNRIAYVGVVRPDELAVALAMIAMLLSYRKMWGLASVTLVVAVLTKQTMLMFAIVPPLAVAADISARDWRRLALSAAPGTASCLALLSIAVMSPAMWIYMVTEAAQYKVYRYVFVKEGLDFLGGMAPVWIGVAAFLTKRDLYDAEDVGRLRWASVAFITALFGSLLGLAKGGGTINSMLPVYYVSVVMAWLLIGPLLRVGHEGVLGAVFVIAIALFLRTVSLEITPLQVARSGENKDYAAVISYVRSIRGHVTAPNYPSITLMAKGQHDPSMHLAFDTAGWPDHNIPEAIEDDMFGSETIVQRINDSSNRLFQPSVHGYRPIWKDGSYVVWSRDQTDDFSRRVGKKRAP